MRGFGRQGPAGAEGTQRAGALLVGSSPPATKPEGASVPQPSSSACISSSRGAPGTGWCWRREGRILARLPSRSCLAADGRFEFQEHSATASPWGSGPAPGSKARSWGAVAVFDVVAQLPGDGRDNAE